MFMRPTLAPQPDFRFEFSRCDDYVIPFSSASHYIIDLCTLEGQNVLCFVSYSKHPTLGDTVAFFSFFKIPSVYHSDPPVPIVQEPEDAYDFFWNYAKQVDSGIVVRNYLKSEFMHHKLFEISTDELLFYLGRLITCISY